MDLLQNRQRPEGFVLAIVAGGLAVLVGLWVVDLFAVRSPFGGAGVGLVVCGIAALAVGIWSELDVSAE